MEGRYSNSLIGIIRGDGEYKSIKRTDLQGLFGCKKRISLTRGRVK